MAATAPVRLHHRLLPPPPCLKRVAPVAAFCRLLLQVVAKHGLQRFTVRNSIKLQCSYNGSVSAENNAVKFEEEPNAHVDGIDELERQLNELFTEVKTLVKTGNKNGAIDLLQANYEAVKERIDGGFKGIEQAAILDVLALGFMFAGDFEIVQNLLELLKDIMHNLEDSMPLVDSILIHMGSLYTNVGNFEEAKLVYGRSLKLLEREYGSQSPFLVTPLMGMAKVFGMVGKSTKAIETYQRVVGILEMNRGLESEELVVPIFNLANLLMNEGKVTDAEICFSRILSIYTKAYGDNDGRVGMAICALAHNKYSGGSVEEAIDLYKRGLQIIKESNYLTFDDYILEKMMLDLAELLHVAGREREGRQLLEECLQLSEKSQGFEHPSTVMHLLNLATSYSHSKNFLEAEQLLRTCINIMSRTVDVEDASITVPMLQLAVALYHLKQDDEAEALASEVVHIREKAFGKDSLPVGEALDCLVSIQNRLERGDGDLLAMLRRILEIQEKELGYESVETITTVKKIMYYLDKLGKRDEKMSLQRRLSSYRTKDKQTISI